MVNEDKSTSRIQEKSMSGVDEKLIMNALQSAAKPQNRSKYPRSAGQSNFHSKEKSSTLADAKGVIIYYNDPQTKINVNDLLTNYSSEKQKEKSANWREQRSYPKRSTTNGSMDGNWRESSKFKSQPKTLPPTKSEASEVKKNRKADDNGESKSMSEPITIYYTAQDVSAVIENVESQLKSKQTNGVRSDVKNSENSDRNSSQTAVIQPKPLSIVNGSGSLASNDDVINGGESISMPVLPETGSGHRLICTLVSHPGHFYIKFLNPQAEQLLANMATFYNSEEPIELSIDVLKANQYFAANKIVEEEKRWIRVQLLNVESCDLIHCVLIDEGGFGLFKLNQLQPLYNQFRALPKCAIRVSLADVKPKESDWLPNEVLEFKSLVENRTLHTGVQRFSKINWNENNSLQLELYFEEDDKSVSQVMIEKDIALKK